MRRATLLLAGLALLLALPLSAQTVDEIVSKYVKTIGGMDKIDAVKTLRRTGKFTGGGGFQATVTYENKRPGKVREDFILQGMDGVQAYDGHAGWKIEPWEGKKDAEALGEEELKSIVEDSDFDGPLVNWKAKGNKVEYEGMEPVEGTDAYKLKVTVPNGDVFDYFMDTDYYVPIKINSKRFVRGEERNYETSLGDYKEVNGWYLPFATETGMKGSSQTSKITWEKIEANVDIPDSRFARPPEPGAVPSAQPGPDASNLQPKNAQPPQAPKTPATEEKKPPVAERAVSSAQRAAINGSAGQGVILSRRSRGGWVGERRSAAKDPVQGGWLGGGRTAALERDEGGGAQRSQGSPATSAITPALEVR